jgi:hypothetical protein
MRQGIALSLHKKPENFKMSKSTTKRIILLFFCLIPIFSKGQINLDSLVKTHKKVAVLPVRVKYIFGKITNDSIRMKLEEKEHRDGFICQEKIYNALKKDEAHLKVEVQNYKETNSLLENSQITIKDLEELPYDVICKSLKVDGVINNELKFNTGLSDFASLAKTMELAGFFSMSGFGYLGAKGKSIKTGAKSKDLIFTMIIADGNTGEEIKEYMVALNSWVLESTESLIERALMENFKKSPYYKK